MQKIEEVPVRVGLALVQEVTEFEFVVLAVARACGSQIAAGQCEVVIRGHGAPVTDAVQVRCLVVLIVGREAPCLVEVGDDALSYVDALQVQQTLHGAVKGPEGGVECCKCEKGREVG